MGSDAVFQDPDDPEKTVSEGMNQLDIVKHSVKTVIHTLTANDRLSIVGFSSNAKGEWIFSDFKEFNWSLKAYLTVISLYYLFTLSVAFHLSGMDEQGKLAASQAVELLQVRLC